MNSVIELIKFFLLFNICSLLCAQRPLRVKKFIVFFSSPSSLGDIRKRETITDAAEWKGWIVARASATDVIDDDVTVIYRIEEQRRSNSASSSFLHTRRVNWENGTKLNQAATSEPINVSTTDSLVAAFVTGRGTKGTKRIAPPWRRWKLSSDCSIGSRRFFTNSTLLSSNNRRWCMKFWTLTQVFVDSLTFFATYQVRRYWWHRFYQQCRPYPAIRSIQNQ